MSESFFGQKSSNKAGMGDANAVLAQVNKLERQVDTLEGVKGSNSMTVNAKNILTACGNEVRKAINNNTPAHEVTNTSSNENDGNRGFGLSS